RSGISCRARTAPSASRCAQTTGSYRPDPRQADTFFAGRPENSDPKSKINGEADALRQQHALNPRLAVGVHAERIAQILRELARQRLEIRLLQVVLVGRAD